VASKRAERMSQVQSTDLLLAESMLVAGRFVRRLDVPSQCRDDILQEAAIVVWKRIDWLSKCDEKHRKSWVRGVVYFTARNHQSAEFRRTSGWRRLRDSYEHEAIAERIGGFGGGVSELAEVLTLVLSALKQQDRDLLLGQVWDGLSTAELGVKFDLSECAVRQRLSRARTLARNSFDTASQKLTLPTLNSG
jgi:RNA polymerase sigma factor (sigma-70 family)